MPSTPQTTNTSQVKTAQPPSRWLEALAFAALLLALALPRLAGLNRFATPDEQLWLTRSANFYYALAHLDFASTFQVSHPGVTTMWAGAAGFWRVFPKLAQADLGPITSPRLHTFLEKRAPDLPLRLLVASRRALLLLQLAALALAYLCARRLFGLLPAWTGFTLLAFDPLHLGLSRLLHLDATLAAFTLLAGLAFQAFLASRRPALLFLSSLATGLACLTKSPGFFLFPLLALLALAHLLRQPREAAWPQQLRRTAADLLAWSALAALTLFALWPALWLHPFASLGHVLGDALGYAAGGHTTPVFFNGRIFPDGEIHDLSFYPIAFLWRSTPSVLLGLLALPLAGLSPRRSQLPAPASLLLLAAGFLLLMNLGAKKFDRYILPSCLALDLLAGLGLAWLTSRPRLQAPRLHPWLPATLLTALLALQAGLALHQFPYYLTYYNPLLGGPRRAAQVLQIGWGEGLDQAARYLNSRPDPQNLKVAAWYATGPFSYFSKSQDSSIATDQPWTEDDLAALTQSDYAVIYIHQWQRDLPAELLDYLAPLPAEHSIWIDGLEYVRIYRLR
jgi:4-amino-4-deoxy-L-arabinose transferase-like glycosyltransferase